MSKLLAAWVVVLILIGTMMLSVQPASASNGATFDFDLHRTSPNLSLDNNARTAAAAKPGDSISINPVTAATGSAGTAVGSASQSRSLPQVSAAGLHLDGVTNDVSCTGTTGTSPATTASCSTPLSHLTNVLVVINTAVAGTTTVSSVTVGTFSATALTGGTVNSGTSERTEVWYVFLTSSATDTVTVTFSGTVRGAMVAQSFTGTATSEPFFDSTATITASGSGSSPQTASVSVAAGTLSRRIFQAVGAATTVAQTTGTIGPSGSWVSSPQTEIAKSQLSASTSIPVTAESNSILPTTAGADNSAANTMSATFSKTLSPAASLAWATVGTAILASGSGVTITKGSANSATQLEPQRAIWQNPRGQKAFYVIVQQGGTTGLHLFRSTDGSSWTDVVQLAGTGTGYTTTYSASAYPYDPGTGSQLVVYVCYAEGARGDAGQSNKIYYRRLVIPDTTDTPTVGAQQDTGHTGGHCNIARDRNGYVHILKWGQSNSNAIILIFGTTATNPGDVPSWSSDATVANHGGSASIDDTSALLVFGGSGNILGVVGQHRAATPNLLYGMNIASFNGVAYSIPSCVNPGVPSQCGGFTIESGSASYHPMDAVVDSGSVAHLVFHDDASGKVGLRYTKATAANTVESWDTVNNIDGVAPDSASLSIDLSASPNRLYVFYQKATTDTIFWRSKTVDTADTAWSSENSIVDGSGQNLDWIQSGRQLQQCVIPLMYTTQTSFMARFVKFTGTSCTASLDHFTMTGYPSSATAGQNFGGNSIVVTAYDAYGNVKTDYTGQVYFTSIDPQGVLPYISESKYQFVQGDGGTHTFAGTGFTLKTTGSQTITVTDGTKSVTSSPMTVNPAGLDHFVFAAISSPQTSGVAFIITITARDAYENTVPSYTGSNSISDSTGTISPTSTGAFTSGVWTGSVTITKAQVGVTISTSGGGKSGESNSFDVNPAGGNKLVITVNPSSVTVGSWTTVYTVQRQDQYGNPVTSGTTTVNLASTSTGASKKFAETPSESPVTSVTISDGSSTRDFYCYEEKAGTWTISVSATDLTGDSKSLTVNPGSLASFTMTGYPTVVTAGQSFEGSNVVVIAYDALGNVKIDYVGQVYFTSTDELAVLPYTPSSKYTFTAGTGADNGVHAFAGMGFTLRTLGSQSISVTDATVSLTSFPITVSPAAVSITITSNPTGSEFVKIDGSSIITPQTFMWVIGSTHDLEALSPVSGGSGGHYVWTSWSDGGGQSHTYTTPLSPQTVTANYGTHEEIVTSTGSGTAYFDTNTGALSDLSAVNEASLPAAGKPNLVFSDGFFSFTITGLTPGGTASVTLTLPSAVPVGAQYWKYGPTPTDPTNHWYQLPMGDDDGDNVITITLVDGGLGDDDLTLDGVIIDQGGPANQPAPVGAPVGGYVAPVNKLAILMPYLALLGAIAAVTIIVVAARNRPKN